MKEMIARRVGSAVFWRATELVGSRAITIIRTLVLAVLLVPEDFGLLAIASVAVNVTMGLTELGLVQALIQKTNPTGRDYDEAWTARVLRALVVTASIVGLAPFIASGFGVHRAVDVIRGLGFRPLLESFSSIRVVDLTRDLRFRPRALMRLSGSLADAVVAILLAQSMGVWALVLGSLVGATVESVFSYLVAPYRPRPTRLSSSTTALFRFGRWILLTTVLSVVGGAALRLIVSRVLGPEALGLFFLAASIAFLPNDTMSQIVGEVAFPAHSSMRNDPVQGLELFRISLLFLMVILIPVYVIMIALAPALVAELLSSQWSGTERLIQLMAVCGIIGALTDAVSPLLEGRGQPQKVSQLFALHTFGTLVFTTFLTLRLGLVGAALALLLTELLVQAMAAHFASSTLQRPFEGILSPVLGLVAASACGAVFGLVVSEVAPGPVGFSLSVLVSTITAFGMIRFLDRRLGFGFAEVITHLIRLRREGAQSSPPTL